MEQQHEEEVYDSHDSIPSRLHVLRASPAPEVVNYSVSFTPSDMNKFV